MCNIEGDQLWEEGKRRSPTSGEMLGQRWDNVGPTSATLAQHCPNAGVVSSASSPQMMLTFILSGTR